MANVGPIDGIMYGFRLMGYTIGVLIVGIIIAVIGAAMIDGGSEILGGLISIVGFLAFFAGFAGVQYKIIADGVEKGMIAARE